MIYLTIYKETEGKKEKKEFSRLQDAIEFGQKTGNFYDIFDPSTGKVIDWTEINFREEQEDEWYYDEAELLWKKMQKDDHPARGITLKDNCAGLFRQSPNFTARHMYH